MRDATRFTLDARTMRVTFTAWLGPLRVEGHFGELHGALVLPNTDIERATLASTPDRIVTQRGS